LNRETLTAVPFDKSAGAGLVLDVEALAEPVAELFRNDARRGIGDAAGRERQHDAHGLDGIGGLRAGRTGSDRGYGQRKHQQRDSRENPGEGTIKRCHG
jgi:hypothetical protein